MSKTKRIIIKTAGPIRPKSMIYGPILTPYLERIETVVALVAQKYDVYEILENGKEVKLTLLNVNKDNNKADEEAPKAPEKKQNVPVVENKNKNQQKQQQPKQEVVDPSNNKVEDTVVKK